MFFIYFLIFFAVISKQEHIMIYRAKAPVRIDFAGGWTDVADFCMETKGKVVNAAINIYSYASLWGHISGESGSGVNNRIRVESADFDLSWEADNIKEMEYSKSKDLAQAAIKMFSSKGGFKLITRSNAPPGSGLGTSAAMGVAIIAVIAAYNDLQMVPYEFAEGASAIERKELGILGGKQDHYASALGGINFMEFSGEEVKASPLRLHHDVLLELEKNLVVCYTGKSRLSGNIHRDVRESFMTGAGETRNAIERLKEIAEEMKKTLLSGDLERFGGLLSENWKCQKALHPSTHTEQIDDIFEVAYKAGALGGKASGAGGGGCLIFYCRPDTEHLVRKALEHAGTQVIDFNFDHHGLQCWNRS